MLTVKHRRPQDICVALGVLRAAPAVGLHVDEAGNCQRIGQIHIGLPRRRAGPAFANPLAASLKAARPPGYLLKRWPVGSVRLGGA
jgi:hypothetical protein